MLKLNDAFTDFITDGIFTYLNSLDVPWKDEALSNDLNLAYHGNHSGMKFISPVVKSLMSDGVLDNSSKENLSKMIFTLYGKNWAKLWETLIFEYNPIENYRMTEIETGTETGTGSRTTSQGNAGTVARTSHDTVVNSATNENDVYGFNSSTAVKADGHSETANGETETTESTTTNNSVNGAEQTTDSKNNSRELTRSGNIGVTTSQQMIESERTLWEWFFYNNVFNDLDRALTIQIY